MPFSNYPIEKTTWNIELNVHEIWCYLEELLDMSYPYSVTEGSAFWDYIIKIEDELNQCDSMPADFWEWFDENYDQVEDWITIEENFIDEDEHEWNQRDIRILGFNTKDHPEYGELWQDLLFEIQNSEDYALPQSELVKNR